MQVPTVQEIGGFRIVRELKGGAQGKVYQAVCERDDLPLCPRGTMVAVKTMVVQDETQERYARLERRTRELMRLHHRNVVRYLGCFRLSEAFAELHAVVLEYLDGETLKERLERHPGGLDADEAVKVSVAMVSALAEAEAHGICHRDVKPGNVFLCRNGDVKLIDFEVARLETGSSTSGSGRMIGTFDYMAPDFADPAFRGDYCSDVFSVGVVMHEAIAGRTPYRQTVNAGDQADFLFMSRWVRNPDGTCQNQPIVISSKIRRLLAHADTLMENALSPDRSRRPASFAAFADELRKVRFRDLINGGRAYRILQLVGKGGFGEVFKARDKATGRLVAVKHLLKAAYAERFHREAKIMMRLNDPCFVRFVDFFVVQQGSSCESFLLMDFLDGMPGLSLKDAIRTVRGEGLPRRDVLRAFARYAHGLAVMHAQGIYHRDVKPANLYYPVGRLEHSAIMDLGIARDVNGTETTGGVPGTFDYMPPEVVTQQTRGESGMDVYALGLCLYEALTGKLAYPKLPTGTAAYATFFHRAKTLARPNLDGLMRAADADVLQLVREMTEPDVHARLTDTAALERRLWELAGERNPFARTGNRPDATASAGLAEDELPTRDSTAAGDTVKTFALSSEKAATLKRLAGRSRQSRRWPKAVSRGMGIVVALLALVVGGYSLRGPVWQGVAYVRSQIEQRRQAEVERKAADARRVVERKLAKAVREADMALAKYDDEDVCVEACDAEFARWLDFWTGAIATNEIARIAAKRTRVRERRLAQDAQHTKMRETEKRRRHAADVVVAAYATEGTAAGDRARDQWLTAWRGTPETQLKAHLDVFARARENRQRGDQEGLNYEAAKAAAVSIKANYRVESLVVADRRRGLWETEWRSRLTPEHFKMLSAQIDESRSTGKARQNEKERRLLAMQLERDCVNLCEMLEPLETRRSRLDDADRMLTEGLSSGVLEESLATRLRKMINDRRGWTVFSLVNRMDEDVVVGRMSLARGHTHLFVFTNGVPKGLSFHCRGFEPRPLGRADDGRSLRISRDELTAEPVAVTVPCLEDGVVCRIDGVRVTTPTVRLMPGNHVCIYSRPQSRDQTVSFVVEHGTPLRLAGPEVWQVSDEVEEKNREATRRHEIKEIVGVCRKLMRVEPVLTRRRRLAACDGKLREWGTDAILGAELIAQLREELARENARVVGIVSNRSSRVLRVGGTAEAIQVPAHSATRLSFASGLPEHASLQVAGYDPVELPADFDGRVFVFDEKLLVDSPVRVTVPLLPQGVACLVDGRPTASICELRPGPHAYVYRKDDCADIRGAFTVTNNAPMSLPVPTAWQESSALASLESAWNAMNEGAVDKVERFLEAAEVQSEENMRRKRELQRQVALRKHYVALKDEANGYYDDEMWSDALRLYAELKTAGYVFTAEELMRSRTAYDKGRARCRTMREGALAAGNAAGVESGDEELRRLHRWHDVVEGKTGRTLNNEGKDQKNED